MVSALGINLHRNLVGISYRFVRLRITFFFLNSEYLPEKMHLTKRPLTAQQSRSGFILVFGLPNLLTKPSVCVHKTYQR